MQDNLQLNNVIDPCGYSDFIKKDLNESIDMKQDIEEMQNKESYKDQRSEDPVSISKHLSTKNMQDNPQLNDSVDAYDDSDFIKKDLNQSTDIKLDLYEKENRAEESETEKHSEEPVNSSKHLSMENIQDNPQHNNSVYPSDECDKPFPDKTSLSSHKSYIHKIEVSVCQVCCIEFENKLKLQKHVNSVHNNSNMQCELCSKMFKNQSLLYGHKKVVHEVTENLACPLCGIKVMNAYKLRKHLKRHCPGYRKAEAIPTKPQLEKRKKKRKNNVTDMTVYQKQRRDLVQKWKEIKKEQMNVKSDEKNQCEECGKSFSHNEKLHNHISIKHTYDPCTCPFCGGILDNKSYLKQHIKQFHRDVSTAENGIKKMKKGIKMNNVLLEELPMTIFKTENDGISESNGMKAHPAEMHNDNGETEKEHSSEEPVQIKVEANDEHEDKDKNDPQSCPYCEGTILKNKTYLTMHINRFHEGYKLPDYYKTKNEEENINTEAVDGFECTEIVDTENKLESEKEENLLNENYVIAGLDLSAEKIKKFICDSCDKVFEKVSLLKKHEEVHSDQNSFVCSDCPKTFTTKGGLDYHTLSHTNETPFMCDLCSKTFRTKFGFKQHKLAHTGEKPYSCDECGKAFSAKDNIRMHKKKGNCYENKPLICTICSKTFKYGANLKSHEIKCKSEKSINFFVCSECEKTFKSEKAFEDHICNKDDKICSICGGEFKNSWDRSRHQRRTKCSQMGAESYVECKVCGKTCKSKYALKDHTYYVHPTEEKRKLCSICGKEFKNSQNLRQHQRKTIKCSQTSAESYAICPECGKDFHNKHALYNHNYYTHIIENVNCPKCGKTCKSKLALRLHVKRTCAPPVNLAMDAVPIDGIQG